MGFEPMVSGVTGQRDDRYTNEPFSSLVYLLSTQFTGGFL